MQIPADTFDLQFRAPSSWIYSQASGYTYTVSVEYSPAANAPCATSNDGGSGLDAPDEDPQTSTESTIVVTGGQITGTICQDYDDEDYYQVHVQSGQGVFASLEWVDSDDELFEARLLNDSQRRLDTSVMSATKDDASIQAVSVYWWIIHARNHGRDLGGQFNHLVLEPILVQSL